jgi:signal transduction histidine kinase
MKLPQGSYHICHKAIERYGLRLYISKSIIEVHGGKIWAKNNEEENGEIFGFSLPLNQD